MDAKNLIGHISGGKVLDVATGNGGFIHFLLDGLKDYDEIIGIDTRDDENNAFDEQFAGKPIRYQNMDAAQMEFADQSFDTVCVSISLHHMPDLSQTLNEIMRVLKPEGYLIVSEMFCNDQTETQMTHVHLHHWWAEVDRAQGICHNETFRCEQITEVVAGLGLVETQVTDLSEMSENPFNPEIMAQLNPVIDRYIARADGYPELQTRGNELRERLTTIGFDGATTMLITGKKNLEFDYLQL